MIISREKAGFEHDEEAMNAAVREDIMLHAYMLTQSGIPMLYSGDELGQVNDYSYKNDPEKCADSRYIHRGKLPWELAEDKEDVTTVQGNIFQTLDRLEKIRRQEITFDKDADVYTYDMMCMTTVSCVYCGNIKGEDSLEYSTSAIRRRQHGCRKKGCTVIC
jgi:amylosucrase